MRRLLPVLLLLALSACSTTVGIDYTQPSEVDMSSYRKLAVAPVKAYEGLWINTGWIQSVGESPLMNVYPTFSTDKLCRDTASYAGSQLMGTLSASGYYELLPPAETAGLISSGYEALRDAGWQAVLLPEVTLMDLSEKVRSVRRMTRERGADGREILGMETEYILVQTAVLEYTLRIVDTSSGEEIASRSFRDSRTKDTWIDPTHPVYDDMDQFFRNMLRGFNKGINALLVPVRQVYDAKLVKNKPKLKAAGAAYDALASGDRLTALALFRQLWDEERHVPSGCNAALLSASEGDFVTALELLEEVVWETGDGTARDLLNDLSGVSARNSVGEQQTAGLD